MSRRRRRRLPRLLLNAATVASLVLLLATVVLWGRGIGLYVRPTTWGRSIEPGALRFRLGGDNHDGLLWILPYWKLILLALVFPIFRLRLGAWSRRHPTLDRRCTTCGYDLRATPNRCPECGLSVYDPDP